MTEFDPFSSTITEAANRAEATALLIRCGYRVYRPEADMHGEDLVVRDRDDRLHGVQMKARPTVHWGKYGGRDLQMLFPSARYNESISRVWFLLPHDDLFRWVEERHSRAPKWNRAWTYPLPPKQLRSFLEPYVLTPIATGNPDKFVETGDGLLVYDKDGNEIDQAPTDHPRTTRDTDAKLAT